MARSSLAYEKDILDGLHWLGLVWDEGPGVAGEDARGPYGPYRQMERLPLYAEAAERLLAADSPIRATAPPRSSTPSASGSRRSSCRRATAAGAPT